MKTFKTLFVILFTFIAINSFAQIEIKKKNQIPADTIPNDSIPFLFSDVYYYQAYGSDEVFLIGTFEDDEQDYIYHIGLDKKMLWKKIKIPIEGKFEIWFDETHISFDPSYCTDESFQIKCQDEKKLIHIFFYCIDAQDLREYK